MNLGPITIPSSFVKRKLKLNTDTGNGEAKLFIGSNTESKKFDKFFNEFNNNNEYYFNKDNLIQYMENIKFEYITQVCNKYHDISPDYYYSQLKSIKSKSNHIEFKLEKYQDAKRYYIKDMNKDIFNECIRDIALPIISVLTIEKVSDNKFYFKLDLNYDVIENLCSQNNSLNFENINKVNDNLKYQRIFFGAPGTGKSYLLNKEAKYYFGNNFERVTFHPNYMYGNFVGSYKPAMQENNIYLDQDTNYIIDILRDNNKNSQEKYNELYDIFKDNECLTRLPTLLGLYTDGDFKTKKRDGTYTSDDNSTERNMGRSIRKYVNLYESASNESNIVYKYVPGPFMRVYVNAQKSIMSDNPQPYLLIIEEINRANVSAVFGDVFQLLDRSSTGESEYAIHCSEEIKKYLAEEIGGDTNDYQSIKIPSNMYIWATMNSADQGVMPMDTAFRRRWDFEYLGINDAADDNSNEFENYKFKINENEFVYWDDFRRALNDRLSKLNIPEDKLIGPYFISREKLENLDLINLTETVKNKVLMYLYEDAAKAYRSSLFAEGKYSTYSSLCENFEKNALNIFKDKLEVETFKLRSDVEIDDKLDNRQQKLMVAEDSTEYDV